MVMNLVSFLCAFPNPNPVILTSGGPLKCGLCVLMNDDADEARMSERMEEDDI